MLRIMKVLVTLRMCPSVELWPFPSYVWLQYGMESFIGAAPWEEAKVHACCANIKLAIGTYMQVWQNPIKKGKYFKLYLILKNHVSSTLERSYGNIGSKIFFLLPTVYWNNHWCGSNFDPYWVCCVFCLQEDEAIK